MSVDVVVAYAHWAEGRRESLGRLLKSMSKACPRRDPLIVASTQKEHASKWALRLWTELWRVASVHSHVVFLNDDVTVCPRFVEACEAIASVLPDEVVSLHTTHGKLLCLACGLTPDEALGGACDAVSGPNHQWSMPRWARSYWLTGPGYMVPRARLASLVRFAEERRGFFEGTNEDNLVMQWAWSEQRPIWHCVPALVKHDASVPSTCGFDHHPDRVSKVTWERWLDAPLWEKDFWRPRGEPPFVECPWMPVEALRYLEARWHAAKSVR